MPSLRDLRHRLSSRFDGYESYTLGVQSVDGGGYSGTASGTDANYRLPSTDLADLDLPRTGSDTSATNYDGAWVYVPDMREQRRVVNNGYVQNVAANTVTTSTSSAAIGYLVTGRRFSSPVPGGTIFEAHRWPVRDDDRKKGLHTAINEALERLFVRDRLSLTGLGTTVNRYTLAAYPWITDEAQLVDAQGEETISGLDPYPLYGMHTLRLDADTMYLVTGSGVATGDTFTIDVMRPRSSWIKRGATWGESTVGLVDDSDECTGNADLITNVAEFLVCRAQENRDPEGPRGQWGLRAARLAVAVAPFMKRQMIRTAATHGPARGVILANVPGGLREVSGGGSTGWP